MVKPTLDKAKHASIWQVRALRQTNLECLLSFFAASISILHVSEVWLNSDPMLADITTPSAVV
jgi:hypothetical protein